MRFNLDSKSNAGSKSQAVQKGVSSPEAVAKFNSSIQGIEALRQELDEKMNQLREQFKQDFSVIVNDFFAAVPRIKSLTWTQYTPYFNDGDTCTFRMHDIYFATDENEDFESYREDCEGDNFSSDSYSLKDYMDKEEVALCLKLENVIQSNEELMQEIYGDHVIVVVTANGAETQEYDHD